MTKPTAKRDAMPIDVLKAQTLTTFEEGVRDALEAQIVIYGQMGFMIDVGNPPAELSDSFAQDSEDVIVKILHEYEAVGWKTSWAHFVDEDDIETSFRISLA